MAQQYSLEAQPRTIKGKQVKTLRRVNLIPAVIYGAGGDPVHVTCPRRALEIVLSKAGSTHLINVEVSGSIFNTLVREVQRDAVRRDILHVDFLRVDLTKTIRTEVPITLMGTPKLTSELQMQQNVSMIEVESLPTNIPEHIEIHVANLTELGAQITVADIPALEGVSILADPTEVIVRIVALAAESADTAPEGVVSTEPEVIEKGKKEEEDF